MSIIVLAVETLPALNITPPTALNVALLTKAKRQAIKVLLAIARKVESNCKGCMLNPRYVSGTTPAHKIRIAKRPREIKPQGEINYL